MSAEQDLANANVQIANLISEVTRFRDAAMGINNIWPTITEGRQNTADGKYFSVPGGGAYMRLYRRNGSSQTLIAEFPDRAELNSVIDQLGPLLGRGVVGGTGDLMAQGAFGLGNTASVDLLADWLEQDLPTSFMTVNSSTTGVPDGWLDRVHILHSRRAPAGGEAQLLLRESQIDPTLALRTRTVGGWSPLSSMYSNTNVVGTVSQSGGVPTGAIIERGSNANGEYTKYADGTLVCSFSRSDGSGIASESIGAVYRSSESFSFPDFPHSFITAPKIVCDFSHENGYAYWGGKGGLAKASGPGGGYQYYSARPFNAAASLRMSYVAHGRWY